MMYIRRMRTTITLDDDVAARIAALQKRSGLSFKDAINLTLRAGLERQSGRRAAPRARFKVAARPLGLRAGLNYANIGELLEQIEGPDR